MEKLKMRKGKDEKEGINKRKVGKNGGMKGNETKERKKEETGKVRQNNKKK